MIDRSDIIDIELHLAWVLLGWSVVGRDAIDGCVNGCRLGVSAVVCCLRQLNIRYSFQDLDVSLSPLQC